MSTAERRQLRNVGTQKLPNSCAWDSVQIDSKHVPLFMEAEMRVTLLDPQIRTRNSLVLLYTPSFHPLYSSRSIRVNGQANLGNLSDVCFHDTGPEILCMPKWLPKAAWAGAVAPLSRIWSTIAGEEWPKWGSPVRINSKQPTTLVLHHETSRKAMGASNAKFHMLSQNLVQTTGQPNSPDKSDSVLALPIKL